IKLVRAYFGAERILTGLPYYMAEVMEPAARLEPWHFDCIRPTIKAYLSLDEIGFQQAPLRFVPGSHRMDQARHRLFYAVCRGGLGAAYFAREDCNRLDGSAVAMTAPAGTFILFDTRGSHAGSMCRSGRRVVLANGHRPARVARLNPRMFRDPAPTPYPWQVSAEFWNGLTALTYRPAEAPNCCWPLTTPRLGGNWAPLLTSPGAAPPILASA